MNILQQSAEALVYACVYWQRQTAMRPSATLPPREEAGEEKKKDETFHPIFSNAARHRKALTSSCCCWGDLEVAVERGGVHLYNCRQNLQN